MDARFEWPAIAGDVALALLGEPSSATGRELRFGRRGSLSVDLQHGCWFDHEAGTGGGVLDLVMREQNCDRAGALAWLEAGGFLPGHAPLRAQESLSEPPSASATPLAARLWDSAVGADDSSGRIYLARRWAWPPAGIGPELPPSVQWLPAGAVAANPALKWRDVPVGAVGALVFAWRKGPKLVAVSLLAVSETGARVGWFDKQRVKVRAVGSRTGAVFEARPGAGTDTLHLCEGEVDGLALSLSPWCVPGRIVAVGGTSGLRRVETLGSGAVTIHADGDAPGRAGVERARHVVSSRKCGIEWYGPGEDPASSLAGWVGERAAIHEFEAGLPREESTRLAWQRLLLP